MQYAVVVERSPNGYAAYLPDLPGCVAAAATRIEVQRLIREAMRSHREARRRHGDPIPDPTTGVDLVEVGVGSDLADLAGMLSSNGPVGPV